MNVAGTGNTERELTSWKEIGEYLGVSARTAQRYEAEFRLPVRRLGIDKGRGVSASAKDLEEWKRKNIAPRGWWQDARFLRRYGIGVTLVALALGVYVAWDLVRIVQRGQPQHVYWVGSTLTATDARGEVVWRKSFDVRVQDQREILEQHADLDGDGAVETLVPFLTTLRDEKGAPLLCISSKGKELWRIEPKRQVSDRKLTYSPVYVLRDYSIFPSPEDKKKSWVAAAFVHHYEYPSVAVIVDDQGRQRGEYWHSGHFNRVLTRDLNGDGIWEIVATGVSHARERATLVVLDPRNVRGAGALPEGHERQLRGMEAGSEKAVVHFGRTRLSERLERFNFCTWLGGSTDAKDGSFQVNVNEFLDEGAGYLVYTIRPDLTLKSVVASVALERTYRARLTQDKGIKPFGEEEIEKLQKEYVVERH
jgi:hypothetical protein